MKPKRQADLAPATKDSGIRLSIDTFPRLNEDDEDTEVSRTTSLIPSSTRKCGMPRLTMMSGSTAGEVIALDEKEHLLVGRGRGSDIRLEDAGVSRLHCRITRRGDAVFVEDFNSANGTLVNGTRVACARLNPGDRIQLGASVLLQYTEFDEAEDALARRLYEASIRDPLTGAFSRKYFMSRLDVEMSHARRHGKSLSVVLFDVDWFKRINDGFGHGAGDAVLQALVNVLAPAVRAEDVLTRYGGEEFALLVRETSLKGAWRFADRIRARVEALGVSFDGQLLRVTVSAGVAELAECDAEAKPDAVLRLADERLYRAKEAGRNRVCMT